MSLLCLNLNGFSVVLKEKNFTSFKLSLNLPFSHPGFLLIGNLNNLFLLSYIGLFAFYSSLTAFSVQVTVLKPSSLKLLCIPNPFHYQNYPERPLCSLHCFSLNRRKTSPHFIPLTFTRFIFTPKLWGRYNFPHFTDTEIYMASK